MSWAQEPFFVYLEEETLSSIFLPQPTDRETSTSFISFIIDFCHSSFLPSSLPSSIPTPFLHFSLKLPASASSHWEGCPLSSNSLVHLLRLAELGVGCPQTVIFLAVRGVCKCIPRLFYRLQTPQNNPLVWNCITIIIHPTQLWVPAKIWLL